MLFIIMSIRPQINALFLVKFLIQSSKIDAKNGGKYNRHRTHSDVNAESDGITRSA